jgi:hypothetical protein
MRAPPLFVLLRLRDQLLICVMTGTPARCDTALRFSPQRGSSKVEDRVANRHHSEGALNEDRIQPTTDS